LSLTRLEKAKNYFLIFIVIVSFIIFIIHFLQKIF
jgi:cell division protein FtsL